jgi:hypothetical protein
MTDQTKQEWRNRIIDELMRDDPELTEDEAQVLCDQAPDVMQPPPPKENGSIPSSAARPARELGTPISQLSGRPGHEGFAEFCRIAKSWGYD